MHFHESNLSFEMLLFETAASRSGARTFSNFAKILSCVNQKNINCTKLKFTLKFFFCLFRNVWKKGRTDVLLARFSLSQSTTNSPQQVYLELITNTITTFIKTSTTTTTEETIFILLITRGGKRRITGKVCHHYPRHYCYHCYTTIINHH